MRHACFMPCLLSAAALCPVAFTIGCGSDDNASAADASGDGAAGGLDAGGFDAQSQPDAQTCVGDEAGCLYGTAVVPAASWGPEFPDRPPQLQARLYRTFPGSGVSEVSDQYVARDRTWAFSGLPPWDHYYVAIEPRYPVGAGAVGEGLNANPAVPVLTQVGPFSVPGNSGAPIPVQVKPVQLDVFEQGAPMAALQVVNATGRVIETSQGSSSISISIGGTSSALAWDATHQEYLLPFSMPPAAQLTYEMATSASNNISTWNLVADPPAFTVGITQPAAAQTVSVNQDLTVTWPLQPAADYVQVELFLQMGTDAKGNPLWGQPVHTSQIIAPDVGQEVISKTDITKAGTYLLNVAFTKANCPPADDGCVHGSIVANELFTVK